MNARACSRRILKAQSSAILGDATRKVKRVDQGKHLAVATLGQETWGMGQGA